MGLCLVSQVINHKVWNEVRTGEDRPSGVTDKNGRNVGTRGLQIGGEYSVLYTIIQNKDTIK